MLENRKYLIINVLEIPLVDFDYTCQKSSQYLIYSLDKNKTIIKWDGEDPPFLINLTTKEGPYNNEEIREILKTSEWIDPNQMP